MVVALGACMSCLSEVCLIFNLTGPLCQFHTASPTHEAYIAQEGPQVWRGVITIIYREKELHTAVERLKASAVLL